MATLNDLAYINSTGYHFADYPAFLTWLQDQYKAIYGADVYLEADSQDGQFIAILAAAFYDTAALGASIFNSFSPSTAQGVGLARNVKINGINKQIADNSTVDLLIVGVAGTVITGGVAQDTLNQKWNIPPTTIPGGGSITVTAMAQVVGAVNAQANTVNKIFTPTLGWQTVNNPAQAIAGAPVETDAELRIRQANSTAIPSLTVFEGTVGAVQNVVGVTNARGYENDTGSTDSNGLPAHSISLIVGGGATLDIANAIARHKTPGTQTYGNVNQSVYDSHGMPLIIHFYRPIDVAIKVEVTVGVTPEWSADYIALIKQAVADKINSIGIGNNVLITKLYAPAYLNGTPPGQTYDVVDLQIGKNLDPLSNINIPILFNELPKCNPLVDVTVVV